MSVAPEFGDPLPPPRRGVERVGGRTVTSCMLGCFRDDARTRSESLALVRPS